MSSARAPSSTPRLDARPAARQQPNEQDVRAMGEAFAAARRQPQGGLQQGKAGKLAGQLAKGEAQARDGAQPSIGDRGAFADAMRNEHDNGARSDQGFGLPGQAGAAVPVPAPQVPAPHVDPSAFAQLMSQLWLREREKGAKEVRVEFGRSTWPATGATLVRNTDGVLDIALQVDPTATDYGKDLSSLRERFADRGLAIGTLTVDA
ncbi:hypothetical protein [Sphingomonas crocodyli]|uniref:Flagellar hook-length control protein FliK n=1 Tax=Sphingomonas crocodyli TaxID=1979270 RepID=A0A437M6E5_9SPHN|nr:hypothetical protein [Sphingomonas crocodyli]RVT93278.1 hypothetical protein EOD43_05155 [Sphingomonas crocodyli]